MTQRPAKSGYREDRMTIGVLDVFDCLRSEILDLSNALSPDCIREIRGAESTFEFCGSDFMFGLFSFQTILNLLKFRVQYRSGVQIPDFS